MKCLYSNAACGGMDVHYKFSNVTFRDSAGNVVRRERLEHPGRDQLRERIIPITIINCALANIPIHLIVA